MRGAATQLMLGNPVTNVTVIDGLMSRFREGQKGLIEKQTRIPENTDSIGGKGSKSYAMSI